MPIYRVSFSDPNNSFTTAGYDFDVLNFYFPSSSTAENGELVFERPAPMSGRYSLNGDIVISVPGWGERYLGGSAISVNFPVLYKGEKGIFSAYMMGDSGIALPQGISAHCKQEIADVCEGRYCRFLQYLDLEP
uniref:Uncharacterized protein n=2 Tax=Pseudoalteromonas rubra TaxID=43658 RepID=A0A0F4R0G8_9GAMM|nr:hypothetical protein TW77_00705 [Pseudoalteromonas rubra]